MPDLTRFDYKEEPGADRTTWTTNASGNGDLSWFVKQRGVNRDDGPYSKLRHLGTDGNIWKVQLHSELVYAEGPGGNKVPYVICRFESHREDNQGTNNENWIAIVGWDGSRWKVEPKYSNEVGQPIQFTLTQI
jgi:hypothetical protein